MNKEFLIQLTNNLYKLTLLFPRKEPLRYKMRELADEILANILRITNSYEYNNTTNLLKKIEIQPLSVLDDLEILDSFFEIAKVQNWVSQNDLLKIQEEYSKLKEKLKEIIQIEKYKSLGGLSLFSNQKESSKEVLENNFPKKNLEGGSESQSHRQEKILEFLKEKGRAQVWEIKKIFPEVSKRTLRRDFNNLLKKGVIERIGDKNNTFYRLKQIG